MRRGLGLRAKSRVVLEERDGGIFIRPAGRKRAIAPIKYLKPGAIKLTAADYRFDAMAGDDDVPQ
jgi:bifunctional DNA-binding transcriptional regulator/antitoxin component of YhaV-PrlF toxin-antitoxin module